MGKHTPSLAVAAFLLLVFAVDAFWLFRIGLPHHPPAPMPTPLARHASWQDRQMHEVAMESAAARSWERGRVITTAIVIPATTLFCVAVILLVRRLE